MKQLPQSQKMTPYVTTPLSSSHKFLSQYKIITVIPQEDIEIKQTLEPELEMLARIPKVWRNSSLSAFNVSQFAVPTFGETIKLAFWHTRNLDWYVLLIYISSSTTNLSRLYEPQTPVDDLRGTSEFQ